MKIISIFLFYTLFIFSSCNKNSKLEYALNFAEHNRAELEKVLEHYKDSALKYKAACFLIENMPRYYSYQGWQLDSIRTAKSGGLKGFIDEDLKRKWVKFYYQELDRTYDSHIITAEYLIDNIDHAFFVWENRPWAHSLSFEDFCELVLPYRVGDEPMEEWRSAYYERYNTILDSLYQGRDIVEAARLMINYLYTEGFVYNIDLNHPRLGPLFLLDNRIGTCREACDFHLYVMRALGFPVAIDSYYFSPEDRAGHLWNVIKDTTGRYIPFWLPEIEISREKQSDGRKKGKVYRLCYGPQPPKYKRGEEKLIPVILRNPYYKDVTTDYFDPNRTEIEIQKPIKGNNVYLGVFTPSGWLPIDIAKISRNVAIAENIEPNIPFQPLYYDGISLSPAGYPFRKDSSGVSYFHPDTTQRQEVKLLRKYPMRDYIRSYMNNVLGAKIEGANSPDFLNADIIYEITSLPESNYNEGYPQQSKKYRYIRYTAHESKYAELAELIFYNSLSSDKKIATKIISGSAPSKGDPTIGYLNVNDDDFLTYFFSDEHGANIVFDLGTPQEIKKIVYIPRNDDNFISIGDYYELFYQNGNRGWISLGRKQAEERFLAYDNIPHGALLWLRNLSKGIEEQVFWIEEGKQVFLGK